MSDVMPFLLDSCAPLYINYSPCTDVYEMTPHSNDSNKNSDASESVSSSNFFPDIHVLDHQEIVETEYSNSVFQEMDYQTGVYPSVLGPSSSSSTSQWETSDLFSFELESAELPTAVVSETNDLPDDFDWLDLLGTSDPVELNDINLTPILTHAGLDSTTNKNNIAQTIDAIHSQNTCSEHPICLKASLFESFGEKIDSTIIKKSPSLPLKVSKPVRICTSSKHRDTDDDHIKFDYLSPTCELTNYRTRIFLNNEDLANGKPGQRLQLSVEERKMLQNVGVRLPQRFPLSKADEKALRTVRRKIRNKLSAQASRVRRQEYVTDLVHRVELSDKENDRLRRQVVTLEKDKRDLLSHVRKLRSYVAKLLNRTDQSTPLPLFTRSRSNLTKSKTTSQAATAAAGGTSLLLVTFMILAWTAMVPIPSNTLTKTKPLQSMAQANSVLNFFPGRSRTLLESKVDDQLPADDKSVSHKFDAKKDMLIVSQVAQANNSPLQDGDTPSSDTSSTSANKSSFDKILLRQKFLSDGVQELDNSQTDTHPVFNLVTSLDL